MTFEEFYRYITQTDTLKNLLEEAYAAGHNYGYCEGYDIGFKRGQNDGEKVGYDNGSLDSAHPE